MIKRATTQQKLKQFGLYNDSTGCYKIDIFVDSMYACSTDQSKTCKDAVKRYLQKYPKTTGKVTAFYYYL